jgi:non-specific serine/threonine protein kinase
VEGELDNLRVALRWTQEAGEAMRGLRLALALGDFWDWQSHRSEGLWWLQSFLALVPQADEAASGEWTSTRARALQLASYFAYIRTAPGTARELAEQGLALFRALDDPTGIAGVLRVLGCVARDEGDFARSTALLEASMSQLRGLGKTRVMWGYLHDLAITVLHQGDLSRAATLAREAGEAAQGAWQTANSLFLDGLVAWEQGDLATATSLGEECAAQWRRLGGRRGVAVALGFLLCPVLREQGDLERAIAFGEEGLALGRDLGEGGVIGWACLGLGQAACEHGDPVRAREALVEGLSLFWERGMRWFVARCLAGLTQVARLQGQAQRAVRVAGATEVLLACINAPLPRGDRVGFGRAVDASRAALGDEAFTVAWQAGQALPLAEAVTLALTANPAC